MKNRTGSVALLLAAILVVSLGATALWHRPAETKQETFTIVASFYPLYTAALQVADGVPGVSVTCLTRPTTGCLHDYQLSPAEMTVLTDADAVILNGAGAESFLDQALALAHDLNLIDTSEGVSLLAEEDGEKNEHFWVSPARYSRQVQNLCDGLCKADPDHADAYRAQTAAYREQIDEAGRQLSNAAQALSGSNAVLFHESMAYLADDLGLTVLAELPLGEEQGISADEMRHAAALVSGQRVLFLYDSQYAPPALSLETYAEPGIRLTVDTAARKPEGVPDRDVWLNAVRDTIRKLQEAAV